MKCPNCNGEVENGQKFCDHCGMRLQENKTEERKTETEPVKQKKTEKKAEKKKPEKIKTEKIKSEKNNIGKKILIPVCMLVICLVSFLGTAMLMKPKSVRSDSLQQKLELGNKYLASAEYEKAEVAFSEALKIDKKSPDAAIGLAKIYNEKEKPEEALRMLERASGNMQSLNKKTSGRQTGGYQEVYQRTSDLFRNKGDMERAVQTEDLLEEVKVYVVVTPEPEEEAYVAELDREETEASDEELVISEGESVLDRGMSGEEFPDEEDVPEEEQPDGEEVSVSGGSTSEMTEDDSEAAENAEAQEKHDEIPSGEADGNTMEEMPDAPESMPGSSDVTPENTETSEEPEEIIYNTETDTDENGEFREEYLEIPEENGEEPEMPEEPDVWENSEMPEASDEWDEMPDEMSNEMPEEEASSEALLRSYINDELEVLNSGSGIDGSTVDINNTGALNGNLGYHIEDLNGDGEPELLVISVAGGIMTCEVCYVENGTVTSMEETLGSINTFGGYTEGLSYSVTQECFLTDSGDIGIATHYSGKAMEDGNPCVETSVVLYRIEADRSMINLGGAAIINGSIIREGGAPFGGYEGNADTFCSLLNQCGLSGSWIYDSTDTLEQMGLEENPYQDMSGVPNPLRGGIAAYEGGKDLVIVNADMAAGDSNLYISVQNNTGY